MVNIIFVCDGEIPTNKSNVSCNWLPFLTAYFTKLKVKLVHVLKFKKLKFQEFTRKLALDARKILLFQVFQLETSSNYVFQSFPRISFKADYFLGFPG